MTARHFTQFIRSVYELMSYINNILPILRNDNYEHAPFDTTRAEDLPPSATSNYVLLRLQKNPSQVATTARSTPRTPINFCSALLLRCSHKRYNTLES